MSCQRVRAEMCSGRLPAGGAEVWGQTLGPRQGAPGAQGAFVQSGNLACGSWTVRLTIEETGTPVCSGEPKTSGAMSVQKARGRSRGRSPVCVRMAPPCAVRVCVPCVPSESVRSYLRVNFHQ